MIKRNLYRIITAVCLLLLAAATIFIITRWGQLPDEIATHYNFKGEADGYGGKWSVLIMLGLSWIVFLVLTFSVRNPEKWNMPVEVTEENKSRLYAITRAMMESLKLVITVLFAMLLVTMALGITMPQWAMVTSFAVIILVVVIGMIMMYKNK